MVPQFKFFPKRGLPGKAAGILLVVNAILVVGCRAPVAPPVESRKNAAALVRSGFENLGNGFFYKPDLFMVKLDSQERVSGMIISRDYVADGFGKGRPQYKAIALAPKSSRQSDAQLWVTQEDGYCIEIPVNGGGSQRPCEGPPEPSAVFAVDKKSASNPLKTQLAAIARLVAPGVYTIADKSDYHRDFYAIYRDGGLIFVGNDQPGKFYEGTKVLGYRHEKDGMFGGVVAALAMEGKYIRYDLTSSGRMVSGSGVQLQEIVPELTPEQKFTATDPSGFHIGSYNSYQVIDRMNSLTEKTIEEIESDARPNGLSEAGFLGDRESFKQRLKLDNDYVLGKGFTHQDLAEPLFAVMNILDFIDDSRFNNFTYQGQHYRASYQSWRGFQESLFYDRLLADRDYKVTNLATGKELKFSPLVPYYIARYGFYEGNTSYRVEPAAIIDTFQLRPKHLKSIERGLTSIGRWVGLPV